MRWSWAGLSPCGVTDGFINLFLQCSTQEKRLQQARSTTVDTPTDLRQLEMTVSHGEVQTSYAPQHSISIQFQGHVLITNKHNFKWDFVSLVNCMGIHCLKEFLNWFFFPHSSSQFHAHQFPIGSVWLGLRQVWAWHSGLQNNPLEKCEQRTAMSRGCVAHSIAEATFTRPPHKNSKWRGD